MVKNVTFVLLFWFVAGYAQTSLLEMKIDIVFHGMTLEKCLHMLEDKSGISIVYSSRLKGLKNKVSKSYKNQMVKDVLKDILSENGLGYKVIGGKVVIYDMKSNKKKVTISGYVYDSETGEVLIGCNVYDQATLRGTATNQYGFFSLTFPSDGIKRIIVFSFMGYEEREVTIGEENISINIRMKSVQYNLNEIKIVAGKEVEKEVVKQTKMSVATMKSAEIKAIPAIAGETDLLKAITMLPGIKQGVDGSSGFYVRGGGPDQNLILLDGVPIYNPYHLWGFLSSFNADAINHVEITKGAFPARYGGRISSVLDITMNEGNNQRWKTDFTVGLLSAKGAVSGPLVKDKSSIMITARRTYADLFIVPIRRAKRSYSDYKITQGYNFTDLNVKLNYRFSKRDRLYFSGFASRDKYYNKEIHLQKYEDTGFNDEINQGEGWGNLITAFRWNHLFNPKIFVNTTAYFSSYRYYTKNLSERKSDRPDEIGEKKNAAEYFSNITDFSLKQDYEFFPTDRHDIRFGLEGIYHKFKPGINTYYSETDNSTVENKSDNNEIPATELSAYIEDDFDVNQWFGVNGGIRFSSFFVQGTGYYSAEPRLNIRIGFSDHFSVKAGYAMMTQYLHLLTSSGLVQSSDLWVPVTKNIKPQRAHQFSAGIAAYSGRGYQLEVEGYYKIMHHVIEYKNGADFLNEDSNWENKVTMGEGDAYGFEFFLKKTRGRLTGWIGYTLSWSNRHFEDLNFGKVFPFRYDRRHDVSVTGTYKINKKWSVNASWIFYTGNAVTMPTSSYITPNFDGTLQGEYHFPAPNTIIGGNIVTSGVLESAPYRNNYRLDSYHRLDITGSYTKQKDWGFWQLIFGVTNLYNRMNPSYFFSSDEYRNYYSKQPAVVYYKRTLFPFMPVLSFRIAF